MSNSRNIYVAIVDDDESTCRSLSRLMRAADFIMVSYPSAEAFLCARQQPRFDCLLLDIQLGGMSGIELQKQLAAQRDSTPVIFITAHDNDPEVRLQAQTAGCTAYFRKTESGARVLE